MAHSEVFKPMLAPFLFNLEIRDDDRSISFKHQHTCDHTSISAEATEGMGKFPHSFQVVPEGSYALVLMRKFTDVAKQPLCMTVHINPVER